MTLNAKLMNRKAKEKMDLELIEEREDYLIKLSNQIRQTDPTNEEVYNNLVWIMNNKDKIIKNKKLISLIG